MLTLAANETVLLTMRRHWIVFVGPTSIFLGLLLAPPVLLAAAWVWLPVPATPVIRPILNFCLALYLAGLLTASFIRWLNYYLDVWIITTERIIDIEQRSLFHREISEISLDRVQNVTVQIPGFLATTMHFGNIQIETAGAGVFTVTDVTEFEQAKDLILQYSRGRQSTGIAAPARTDLTQERSAS